MLFCNHMPLAGIFLSQVQQGDIDSGRASITATVSATSPSGIVQKIVQASSDFSRHPAVRFGKQSAPLPTVNSKPDHSYHRGGGCVHVMHRLSRKAISTSSSSAPYNHMCMWLPCVYAVLIYVYRPYLPLCPKVSAYRLIFMAYSQNVTYFRPQ